MIADEKARLRREIAAWEATQSPQRLRASDDVLFHRFLALPQVKCASALLLFWGMGPEPDTGRLAEVLSAQGLHIGLPRCLPGHEMEFRLFLGRDRLVRHQFGMLEPPSDAPLLDPGQVPAALIPALCYDRSGFRLGRGGGFYDRFLARYPGFTVGLCRGALLQHQVPREPHDRSVDRVLTDTQGPAQTSSPDFLP